MYMYQMTKNLNKTGERGASVYTGKKQRKTGRVIKKKTLRGWVFGLRSFAALN